MKRSLIAISLLTFVLFSAACGTSTATTTEPSIQGVVSSISGNSVTINPTAGGQPVTVNMHADTRVMWSNGIDAGRSGLMSGYRVDVWTPEGSQNASRIVIR
jgi:hypothetical protein